jgi:hypothetical protein
MYKAINVDTEIFMTHASGVSVPHYYKKHPLKLLFPKCSGSTSDLHTNETGQFNGMSFISTICCSAHSLDKVLTS